MIFPFHSVVLPTRIFLTICSALTVLLGAVASRGAEMDPGTVDASFDAGWSLGRVVRALALQPDGKLVVGTGDGIYRLNSDGSLDPGFNGGVVMTDGDVLAVALQPDGRIVVGGRFRNVNGTVRGGIARINSDGSVDSSFLGSTSGTDGRVAAIALQADGRLLVGGNFTNFNGSVRNHITRLNADGTLDNTFTPSLVLLVPEGDGVNAIVPLADGKLLIGGGFTTINGTNRNYLARLNASGSLDTTFLNGLNGPSSVVKAVVLQPDGKVLIGGDFTGVNGVSRNRLARLNANGSTDATFGNGLSFAFQFGVSALALQADGKVLAGGGFFGPPDFLVRMNSNGTVDSTFSAAVIPDNSSLDAPITSILVHPDDGKIIIGGTLLVVNSVESKRLARLEASGAVDTTFDTSARGINGLVNTAALHSNGRILIGGAFTRVNGVPRSRFARLNADGTLDTTFPDTAVNGSVNAVAVSTDGKIIIAGDFNRVHGIDRVSIARLNSDGTLDATFLNSVSGVPGGVNAVALQPDGKVLIGGFFRFVNSIARTYIARLNADGTLDNGFQSIFKFSGSLNAIAVRSDGKILVGGRLDLTNNTGRNFVALNTNGSQDTDFIDPANWYVNDIKVQTDSKTLVGGIFGKGLARLNADGSADGSFLNNLQSPFSAQALALQPDGKVLIAGPFAFADGFAKSRVARLLLDGSGDSTFTSTLRGTDQATFTESYHRPLKALIRQPDGKILVAGEFTLFDGVARSYIARLHGASVYRPGEEIIRPPNAPDINNRLSSGPTISPAGLGYWDAASFRLYAGNSGSTNPIVAFITWKNAADQDVTVPIVIIGIAGQQYALGDEIVPPSSADVTRLPATGPDVQPATAAFWHNPTRKLYAADAGGFTVVWRNSGNAPIPMQAVNLWPTNETLFQTHVAGTPPVNLGAAGTFGSAKLLAQTVGVGADPLDVQNGGTFSATGAGRSLVLLSAGNPQESPDIYFQFVKIIRWDDPAHLLESTASVGSAISPPVFHDPTAGAPWVANPLSRYCAQDGYWAPTNQLAPIIPVNLDSPLSATDDLAVIYYQKGTRAIQAANRTPVTTSIGWASQPVRFAVSWPANPPVITIGSSQGTGPLNPNEFAEWNLYVQNDRLLPGFNPNDEHAVVQQAQGGLGLAAFPLRDDLGTAETSEPYVLITYFDALDALRPKVKVLRVETGLFAYAGTAGNLMQRPYPLTLFQRCEESHGFSGPYWRDRKLDFWARAAGDNGAATNIVMRWFYPTQPGFFFPSNYFAHFPAGFTPTNLPAPGMRVAWLDLRAGTPGTPINATYTIVWPPVPELSVGETLVKPKFGLPDVSLQTSVEVIYQQSIANGTGESVKLIDPTRTIEVTNVLGIASDVATFQAAGLTWFPTLPPHLRARLWYDDSRKALRFKGYFLQPPAGEYHILLNVITERERQQLLQLSQDAVFRGHINSLAAKATQVIAVAPNTPFDSLALTAGLARGTGYVTLAFGNSTNLTPASEPVSLEIIRVRCPIYRGEVKVIESDGPFDEKITLRHSGDFAGRPEDYIFEWRTLPPGTDGLPQTGIPFEQWPAFTPQPASGEGALDITIEGPGLFTLSDNYFVCRYQPRTAGASPCGTAFSDWTAPQLAEGWIKRVVGRINPFTQRAEGGGLQGAEERFGAFNKEVNTIVSMISQAGQRFEGSIPFNADAVDSFGLIEIYETVLRRGINLSISGNPPIDYGPANDALLLAAGRLSDLYMLLGNEAYADGSDPTIAFGTDSGVYGAEASTIHCFQNQTATLLEEELALLRGRDDSLQPGVRTAPFYNRLVWNFTGGDGEVAYAANYDIRDQNGAVDGVLNEADAKTLYPQGHGDAWGHYLAAIKGYYHLLHNPQFSWVPRTEAVLVGGVPVQVDYMDERKFARAAAARAQTGVETVSLTYRQRFVEDPAGQWQGYVDSNTNRAWGVSDWGSRAGQGAFFDWAVATALLPPTNSSTGIQKIDRSTVTELRDIASAFLTIQEQMDKADGGLNPLGLTKNTIPFDIDPVQISQGRTHFEQIYERAAGALNNAIAVFNHANNSSQALRRQADSIADFQQNVTEREVDFKNRLIEAFGYPYPDDIGPTGTYPSGYDGPDLYHYMYVDPSALIGETASATTEFTTYFSDLTVGANGTLGRTVTPVKFHLANNGLGFAKPATWALPRRSPGDVQRAHSDLLQAKARFERAVNEYENLLARIDSNAELLKAQYDLDAEEINVLNVAQNRQESLNDKIFASRRNQINHRNNAQTITSLANVAAEHVPKLFSADPTGAQDTGSFVRGGILLVGALAAAKQNQMYDGEVLAELDQQLTKELIQSQASITLTTLRQELAQLHQLKELEQLVRQEALLRLELFTMEEAMQQAAGNYMAALTRGYRLLEDRLRFRQQTAAQVQAYRYRDMAFRIFRNDALQKYRAQFDFAATYVYLAAKAYDFETNLRPGDPAQPGRGFLSQIVRARTVGKINNGIPEVGFNGDPGLADPMARMGANFAVLKSQLGFNNPQVTVREFSLRSQLLRVVPGSTSSSVWREALAGYRVANLSDIPEVRQHLLFEATQLQEPGLIIPFASTVNQDLNFFGWPAGPGDSGFNPTAFSTKIKSISVSFLNYRTTGAGGMQSSVYVYLIPVGSDIARTPRRFVGDTINFTREWRIVDQWLPIPFPLSGETDPALVSNNWIPVNYIQVGQQPLGEIRGHAAFEAWHDSQVFPISEPQFKATRLIGRSVWNDKWLLVIPAVSLFPSDRNEGLNRFTHGGLSGGVRDGNGVSDIRIRMEAYSYSGR